MIAQKKNVLRKEEAKKIALHAQGLAQENSFGKGKVGALEAIRHLGYVQLDTLAVVSRAHHHTLWTRTAEYSENHLSELMEEKKIFEYWSHAAAYLPMEDFRFSLLRKNDFLKGKAHWFAKDKKIHKYVLDKIKSEGPMQSKDFEADRKHASWFDWKPAKIALEQLFQNGKLMVSERRSFQKVYDLTERVLPSGISTALPTKEEFAEYLIRSTLRAHGIASLKDMTHLRAGMNPIVQRVLRKMVRDGEISLVNIHGISEDYFQSRQKEPRVKTQDSKFIQTKMPGQDSKLFILSPFDNAIIRRDRVKNLFDYDFMLECYLPEHKRKFGYFCLPVLYENEFVGKFDPKADRATGIFYVKSFHLENSPQNRDEFLKTFSASLKNFAKFNGCDKIVVGKTFPGNLKQELKKILSD